jgi:G:T-mismatch repair DNA endonuclease (very short patch repair protein)
MDGTLSTHWEERNAYEILVGEPEEKRKFWITLRKWEYNIKRNTKRNTELRRMGIGFIWPRTETIGGLV